MFPFSRSPYSNNEFMGAAFNVLRTVLVFYPHFHPAGIGALPCVGQSLHGRSHHCAGACCRIRQERGDRERVYFITSSPPLRTEWRSLYGRLRVAHLYGDASVLADLISRARWAEFRRLCAMLGVRPQLLELPSGVQTTSCTGWSSRTCGSALTSPPQLGESSTLILLAISP